ncbi:MAG TPA: DUF6064 family protein [Thermoanaerobaculia bacterium]
MPFTPQQFFDAFVAYNSAIFPVQFALLGCALLIVICANARSADANRFAVFGLGLLWLWSAIAYHWWHFSKVTPAAWIFGAMFLLEGMLLIGSASGVSFDHRRGGRRAGFLLVAYALAVYPLTAVLAGHSYPAQATFGAPCPVTIFTIGLLVAMRPPLPIKLAIIPLLWALIATSAAFRLGVSEDFALLGSAIVLVIASIVRRTSVTPATP